MNRLLGVLALLSPGLLLLPTASRAQTAGLGVFEAHGDVGSVARPGSVVYDAGAASYTVTGGGANMWFASDAFHFVWKKASGDVSLAAEIRFVGTGGNAHRKAALLIRQGLEADAAYADAVVHGDGLTSIQYRAERGGPTREIQANVRAPRRIRIDREGDTVVLSVAGAGEPLGSAGASFKIRFSPPFLVGLGVCSHDDAALETAVFSDVEISTRATAAVGQPVLESTLETVAIASRDRRVVHHERAHLEAPNWSRDGKELLYNSDGLLYAIPVQGGTPRRIDTGFATKCNNDHGLSPDGAQLAISDQSQGDGRSRVYLVPLAGGAPRLITPRAPSYWHGWSPDGKTLAYCAERDGEFDVYTIPADGGQETRLTTAPGLDDGPDYAPDGQWIYFNSERTGTMQIWRMRPDGSEQQPLTSDAYNNWFAHPSPDGRWIAFLSYEQDVKGHPANQDVMIRVLPVGGGEIQVLAKLFGGQGTLNVPSWSPDSTSLAFASYRLVRR